MMFERQTLPGMSATIWNVFIRRSLSWRSCYMRHDPLSQQMNRLRIGGIQRLDDEVLNAGISVGLEERHRLCWRKRNDKCAPPVGLGFIEDPSIDEFERLRRRGRGEARAQARRLS